MARKRSREDEEEEHEDLEEEAEEPAVGGEMEEESSSSSEEDDDEAEARLERRSRRSGAESGGSAAGIIHEIFCQDFMCHRRLQVNPCRRINFINGANGSGKSAILAAMQICLGASAKHTHRGNKMGDLVREGFDGCAVVRVTLVNEGSDAAKPELYGDKITIERKFSRSGGTGNTLKLLSSAGVVVSKDRKELRFILDTLKVSVDNPVCVLDQENSKNFIRGKGKEKYNFFLKATEIETVLLRINKVSEAATRCLADASSQRKKLGDYARVYEAARHEYEEVKRLARFDDEIRGLKVTLAWVAVRGAELARTEAGAFTAEALATATVAEKAFASASRRVDELCGTSRADDADEADEETEGRSLKRARRQGELARAEEELSRLKEEASACAVSTREAHSVISAQQQAARKARTALREEEAKGADVEKERKHALRQLEQIRSENAKRARRAEESGECGARLGALALKVEECEAASRGVVSGVSAARAEADALHCAVSAALDRERCAADEARERKGAADDERRALRSLEAQQSSPLAAFGDFQAKLRHAVDAQTRAFEQPVVGPVGACVRVADASVGPRWSRALDVAVGQQLSRWIVGSHRDKNALLATAKRLGCDRQLAVVVQNATRPRHKVRELALEHEGLLTVESVLRVDSDLCYNALVDVAMTDGTCLFLDKEDAETNGLVQPDHATSGWRHKSGVMKLLCANGDETGARRGNLFARRHAARRGSASLFGVDVTQALPDARQAVATADAERATADALHKTCTQELRAAQREHDAAEKRHDANLRTVAKCERAVRDARDAHQREAGKARQEVVFDDTQGVEQEIDALQTQRDAATRQAQDKQRALDEEVGKLAPLEKTAKLAVKRNDDLEREIGAVEDRIRAFLEEQKSVKLSAARSEKVVEKARKVLAARQEASRAEDARVADVVEKASRFTRQQLGPAWDGSSRPEGYTRYRDENAVNVKVLHVESMKQRELARRDLSERDPEIAKEKMDRAGRAYHEKEKGCKQIESEGEQLGSDAKLRWARLRRIRAYICRKSNSAFDAILQNKGSAGALNFDHVAKTLSLTYQKDNADSSTQIENVQSLSGGERSFSTLAMLIALGETIECPFRVMDEFDVFMDQVSRKVAMIELVEMAKKMESRQFIFITPQDLTSLPKSPIVKIFKMSAPVRGQQTMHEHFT